MDKNLGKIFEEDFKKSVPDWCWIYRFRDGTANFAGEKNQNVRFQAHNICDFEVMANNNLFLLELKSYQGVSIPLSGIRKNQLEGMIKASSYRNIYPYFILNFRGVQRVYAIKVQTLCNFILTANRKSIPLKWAMEIQNS
ncbi:Recombination protein U [Clostridium liquoris]|jgi:recombination protein U|uniref:Holliday junction resolvase RecU n=1 Tax=Clostridium liquoris TaxID=1289519 RepID=A0A2T0B1N0_9CLOT|nr:Holliday junction resolvase RecU [Clostridium liquoris]PRR77669.1 Recombination protein U [Clostridium liquoris]